MALKQWTISAASIEYGRISLWLDKAGDLRYSRPYSFKDAEGNTIRETAPVEGMGGGTLEGGMQWDKVPADIRKALEQIDAFTKSEIEKKEGLEKGEQR